MAMAGRLLTSEQDILRLARAAKRVAVLGCATEQKVRVSALSLSVQQELRWLVPQTARMHASPPSS